MLWAGCHVMNPLQTCTAVLPIDKVGQVFLTLVLVHCRQGAAFHEEVKL